MVCDFVRHVIGNGNVAIFLLRMIDAPGRAGAVEPDACAALRDPLLARRFLRRDSMPPVHLQFPLSPWLVLRRSSLIKFKFNIDV